VAGSAGAVTVAFGVGVAFLVVLLGDGVGFVAAVFFAGAVVAALGAVTGVAGAA
jgi:hypothetical protein